MSNNTQSDLWNGRLGQGWVSVEDYIDRMLEPISRVGLSEAATREQEKAIDIGCGCGTTTLQLAASGASVLGVDISAPMIEKASSKPAAGANVRFEVADAAVAAFDSDHDLLFSRFGVMFFSDPVAAFSNMRSALKPGGRLVFICWDLPAKNPWVSQVGQVLQPFMPADAPRPAPTDPGPFAFADVDFTTSVLGNAGFSDISMTSVEEPLPLGDNLDEVMAFQKHVGPLSGLLENADAATAEAAIAAVEGVFAPHVGDDGLSMTASAWLVTARN